MTEQEWLTCTDPQKMLDFLKGKVSDRKLRLFAVACCRRGSACLIEETRALLGVAERLADGEVTPEQRKSAREEAMHAGWNPDAHFAHRRGPAKAAVFWSLARRAADAARYSASYALGPGALVASGIGSPPGGAVGWEFARKQELSSQAALLRDITGNPFRPITIPPSLLTWRDSTIPRLAQSAYDNRQLPSGHLDLTLLAVLADALEEAGCQDAEVLGHLRSEGPHVRGCWPVDLCLGKS